MKLRFKERIAWYNTIAVAFMILLLFVVIFTVIHSTSYQELDSGISIESDEALSTLNWQGDSIIIYHMPEWEEAEHQQVELNPTFLQVSGVKGNVIFRTANLRKDFLRLHSSSEDESFYNGIINGQHIPSSWSPCSLPLR
jgi:two-component system, OmpR family, heavy metal sensor histidine kinase CusS